MSIKLYFEHIYNEASDVGAVLKIYRDISKGLSHREIDQKYLDQALRYVLTYYQDYIAWNKKYVKQIDSRPLNKLQLKIDKEYKERYSEIRKALNGFDNREKLIALDNGINQLHIDYPILAHLQMDIEETENKKAIKEFNELLDVLSDLLKRQGKELPGYGYAKEKEPRKIISEMAEPRPIDRSKKYYHGTCKIKDAKDIMTNGIKAPDLSLQKKNKLTPRQGKVYITPDIHYAQIYAIGGDMAGSESWIPSEAKEHPFGYLFVIDGKDLVDIEPDEDGVGEIMHDILNRQAKTFPVSDFEKNLIHMAQNILTPLQFKKLKDYGDYGDLATAGRKIIPRLNDKQKLWFIDKGAHVAHEGTIKPKEVWKIDLHKIKDLKRDGSNFFQVAEKIGGNK